MSNLVSPLNIRTVTEDLNRPLEVLANEPMYRLDVEINPELVTMFLEHGFTQRGGMAFAAPVSTAAQRRQFGRFLVAYQQAFNPYTLTARIPHTTSFCDEMVTLNAPMAEGNSQPIFATYRRTSFATAMEYDYGYVLSDSRAAQIVHADFNAKRTALSRKYSQLVQNKRGHSYYELEQEFRKTREVKQFLDEYGSIGGVYFLLRNNLAWAYLTPFNEFLLAHNEGDGTLPTLSKLSHPRLKEFPTWGERNLTLKELVAETERLRKETYNFQTGMEDNSTLMNIVDSVNKSVTLGYVKNKPAQVRLTPPATITLDARQSVLSPSDKKVLFAKTPSTVTMRRALAMQERNPDINFIIHPALADIQSMAKAKPFNGDAVHPLLPFQKEAVGLHLSTNIGYLQTCATGVGKTVMQLAAMRERANHINNYRGLIVCEKNVQTQWEEEAHKWFPEASVLALKKKSDFTELVTALSQPTPVLIITAYSMTLPAYEVLNARREHNATVSHMKMRDRLKFLSEYVAPAPTVGSLLLDTHWDDLCSDESMVIRNNSSKQAQALWAIRANAEVATALTATPINKNLNDIANLLSWVRNDRHLFESNLDDLYDATDPKIAKEFFDSFGPIVFRRDVSDVQKELATVSLDGEKKKMPRVPDPKTMLVTPNPGEKALADAAEHELRRCYEELLITVEDAEAKADGADKDELKKAKEALRAARGSYMGGIQLARMATSDPIAFAHSNAVGTDLLKGQGLVEAALEQQPAKRALLIKEVTKRVNNGERIIVFVEFNEVATLLANILSDNGVVAKPFTGKNGATRDRYRTEFQNGDIDVLVCSKVGYRGVTLHKASTIIHYDIPYTQELVIQRTGRAVRLGSDNDNVHILFFVMKGTVEERVARRVVEASVKASLVLDNSRGAKLSETDAGNAMKGLISTISRNSDSKNLKKFGAMLLGDE